MDNIESIADRMIRIDDTFIPAVNIQIEGFPRVENGMQYNKYFEVLFEYEDCRWEVSGNETTREVKDFITLEVIGPLGSLMDYVLFFSWIEFKNYFLECREDPFRGLALKEMTSHD